MMPEAEDANPNLVRLALEDAHREYNRGFLDNDMARVLTFYEK